MNPMNFPGLCKLLAFLMGKYQKTSYKIHLIFCTFIAIGPPGMNPLYAWGTSIKDVRFLGKWVCQGKSDIGRQYIGHRKVGIAKNLTSFMNVPLEH